MMRRNTMFAGSGLMAIAAAMFAGAPALTVNPGTVDGQLLPSRRYGSHPAHYTKRHKFHAGAKRKAGPGRIHAKERAKLRRRA